VQRLLRTAPLLWRGTDRSSTLAPAGQVTVCLDVSGSMGPWLPVLLSALNDAAELVRWPVLGFSTEVHSVTRSELAQGRFRSTGGTHIGCVAAHLLDRHIEHAVIVTDGEVQEVPAALAARLRRARPRMHLGLLDGCDGRFCQDQDGIVDRRRNTGARTWPREL
jgi:uncharacterized protein with von Willebrand factor type A (vWA) domain